MSKKAVAALGLDKRSASRLTTTAKTNSGSQTREGQKKTRRGRNNSMNGSRNVNDYTTVSRSSSYNQL